MRVIYLSRLSFNTLDRKAWHVLKDPYHLHAAVMRAFPGLKDRPDRNLRSGVLFRLEPQERRSSTAEVLVQSELEPDWSSLAEDLGGALATDWKTVEIAFQSGQRLRFRLRANPSVTREKKRRGIVGERDQRKWLENKANKSGFRLEAFRLVDEGFRSGEKFEEDRKHKLSFRTVLYEGILTVTSPEDFLNSVQSGIGPAKGFGCGLLSVARKLA